MKELAKRLTRMLLGDYAAYYIYSRSTENTSQNRIESRGGFRVEMVDEFALNSSIEPLIRKQAGYGGFGSHAYACFDDDRIVGVCFYWFGDRYRKRDFWPLLNGEAKLVQVISLPEFRGRGVATMLIVSSCQDMMQKGFSRVYARVWHSNTPSLCALKRAGWARVALVVEMNPLRRNYPVRICMGSQPLGRKV
jgi:RimJ/RimL family protein N-acetyltransferase